MTKAVMMSIQPKWVEKILNGEKTIEVRKTAPKLETPFKVYIYCTKDREKLSIPEVIYRGKYGLFRGYDKDYTPCTLTTGEGEFTVYPLNGKVVAEFTCDWIDYLNVDISMDWIYAQLEQDTCLTFEQMRNYLGQNLGYFWHISDLKIYDKPRELGEFERVHEDCPYYEDCEKIHQAPCHLTRPPQSWCYIEESDK